MEEFKKAFTLTGVLMANEVRGEKSITFLSRTNEPKAPFNKIKILMAFTLAEVLITLAIIGVVAALTIPTVIANYQHHQYIAGLKKMQNTLNQAVYMYIAQGGKLGQNCDIDGSGHGNLNDIGTVYNSLIGGAKVQEIEDIKANLKTMSAKGKKMRETYEGEEYEYDEIETKEFTYMDGSSARDYSGFTFLQDGSAVLFSATGDFITGKIPASYCRGFIVDVNGPFKKPNKVGYDVFGFLLSDKGQLVPAGSDIQGYKSLYTGTGKNKQTKYCNASLHNIKGLCATASALSGKNPDGTEYWKGIKYWESIK